MVSQTEKKTALYKAMKKLKHGIFSELDVAYLAKVIKYNPKKHTADILPLANLSDGQKSAQYLDVPVSRNCYIIDELLEKFKHDFEAVDTNSVIKDHTETKFMNKYPTKKFFREGIIVVAVALDRDLDNFDGENTFSPSGIRMHDGNDSIIIGVL